MMKFKSRILQSVNPLIRFWRFIAPYLKVATPTVLLVLFIAAHIFMWWKGPSITISGETPFASITSRVLFSIILTLVVLIGVGFMQRREVQRYYQDKKKEELFNTDIKLQYLQRQRVEFNEMMTYLEESFQGGDHLYDLPWYLTIGLNRVGKTSLLNHSGLEFLFSTALKVSHFKSDNPHSVNWWFSNEALFIDPDSDLLTQTPMAHLKEGETDPELARHLWLDFLEWISEVRARRPLNGLILVVDLPYLVNANVATRRVYAGILRARIQETISMLSSQMPIYVVLSKIDLLHGFEQLFKDTSREAREKLFGFTFSLKASKDSKEWLDEFNAQYAEFLEKLNEYLPKAMMDSHNQEDRVALYSFNRQLAGIQEILSQFLKEVLMSDKYSMQPLIRGVYFTSVYQQGVPKNLFLNESARRYKLMPFLTRAQNNLYSTPFFTYELFNRLILQEAGLAQDNVKEVERKRKRLTRMTIIGTTSALVLLGFVNYYYASNVRSLDRVKEKVELFSLLPEKTNTLDPTGQTMLYELNLIRDATLELGDFHKQTFVSELGLNQGKKVGKEVEATYLRLLNYGYLRHLIAGVAHELSLVERESDEQLELLRVFHMLTEQEARQSDIVKNYFEHYWQVMFPGEAHIQNNLMTHLDYALKYTDLGKLRMAGNEEAINVLSPYDELVQLAQIDLRKIPMEQRIYRSFKHYGLAKFNTPLDLRNEVGPAFDIIFDQNDGKEMSTEIPAIFTKRGIDQYYTKQSDQVYEMALVDDWIIGQRDQKEYTSADLERFKTQIREQYGSDYASVWRKALNRLEVKQFNNISDGVLVFDSILGSNQPFQRLLASVKENTRLFSALPEDSAARIELERSHSYLLSSRISKDFSKLNELLESVAQINETEAPMFNTEVMAAIQNVHDVLKSIQDSQAPGQSALHVAKNRINLNESDPIYALKRIATKLPDPMNRLVNKLADESWNVILLAALDEVDKKWNEEVYREFSTVLAPKYPFSSNAKTDVSLDEFVHFFGKNGTITRFYEDDLSPFLSDNLLSHSSSRYALIKPEVLEQIEMAEKIREAFFNQHGVLGIEFTLSPISMGPQVQRSVLNVEGQFVEYTHGPKHGYSLIWPNVVTDSTKETIVKLTMTGGRQPHRSLTYYGPWALFRMLDQGQVTSVDSHTLNLNYVIKNVPMRYELKATGEINPFTVAVLRNFQLSPSLYK